MSTMPSFRFYLPVVNQYVAISFLDEKYFEEVGLEHFMLRKHPRALAAISCVDVEIYAAIRLVERHFYQTLSLLCHNLNLFFMQRCIFSMIYQNEITRLLLKSHKNYTV